MLIILEVRFEQVAELLGSIKAANLNSNYPELLTMKIDTIRFFQKLMKHLFDFVSSHKCSPFCENSLIEKYSSPSCFDIRV